MSGLISDKKDTGSIWDVDQTNRVGMCAVNDKGEDVKHLIVTSYTSPKDYAGVFKFPNDRIFTVVVKMSYDSVETRFNILPSQFEAMRNLA